MRDTGVGIPPDVLPRVFEHVRAGRSPRAARAQGGLGIGLTLARSLVEMHGGSRDGAQRGRGQGQRVRRAPAARPPRGRRALPVAAVAASDSRHAQRILVVDDNRDAADSLGDLLQLLGAEVRVAYDGAAALEALGAFRPSVVLLDLGMPGMDGYEVARRIRAQPGSGDPTLIALTGWGQASDRQRTQEAGFDHHLVKPVDIGAMQAVLASLNE